jgi:murein DD-endopeptidase MepM/ murein hydrolase activator NlpD
MQVGALAQRLGISSIMFMSTIAIGVAASSAPAGAAGFACSSATPAYTVRAGDSWYVIADRVAVSASALLGANAAELDARLVPGDVLCLPAGADATAACDATHTVAAGEGWGAIARQANVALGDVLGANAADVGRVLHPGEVICLPAGSSTAATRAPSVTSSAPAPAAGASYTVVKGDSWSQIASAAGVTMRTLLGANDADAGDVLVPGEVIVLPAGATTPAARATASGRAVKLDVLPVQGPCWYFDTWRAPRGGGRLHEGVDIITSAGNYVYAVTDGRLTGRDWDQPTRISGNAWKLTAADGTYFYYAHLQGFAPGLQVGSRVKAGEIIGWVGETGNASGPNLHFEIHPGGGPAVNPYPTVAAAGGCNRGTPYLQPSGWTPD